MGDVANDLAVPVRHVPGQQVPVPRSSTAPPAGDGQAAGPEDRSGQDRPARSSRRHPCGLSLADVLHAPSLQAARVLAGRGGLDRVVQRLNVVEVADLLPRVGPHELLLTTGDALRPDLDRLADLVSALDARGVAGMGVRLGCGRDELPAEALRRADALGFPVVQLPEDVGFDDVLDQVLTDVLDRQAAVLARSEEVDRALVQIVLAGGGLGEVTDELVAILGGVVAATTPDGRVLAVSGDPSAVTRVTASAHFDATGRFRVERSRAGVVPDGLTGGSSITVPVLAGGVHHGHLVAFSDGLLDESAGHALERAATVAALVVTKALAVRAVESKYQGDFLRDLLGGRAGGPAQSVPYSASLGWDIDRPLVVLVAELDPAPAGRAAPGPGAVRPAQERFASAWTSVVRARDPRAAVVGFAHEVVALVGAPASADVDRTVRELVQAVTGDGGGGRRSFTCGVSRVVASPEQLPQAYEQARRSVHVGRQLHGPGAVAHFDRLGVFRLLSLVPDSAELRGFVDETLGELAGDGADAVDLRRTLEVLLETNLNVAETARTLHFHYNTLRYRIGKLERTLGPFTRDPALRLNLLLALQVLRMRGL